MGKIRVAALGDENQQQEQKDKRARQREEKKKREKVHISGMKGGERLVAMTGDEDIDRLAKISEEQEKMEAEFSGKGVKEGEEKKPKKERKARSRSRAYKLAKTKVEAKEVYPIEKAVKLLKDISLTTFVGSVELHINTIETGIRGIVSLPHGTGKKLRVVIADEAVIEKVKSGKIDFDILVAHPSMMSKIATVAKVLGPKGLMPNPKAGTISDKPEEVVKKLAGGQVQYKTEPEHPIIHQVIGKMDFDDKKLIENYTTLINAIGPTKITSVTLKSTMSPGIKVALPLV